MQEKTNVMIEKESNIGLRVNTKKTKLLKQNTVNTGQIIVNDLPVDEVDEFTYLGSMVTTDGDSIREVKTRITKARQAFAALNNLWKSTKINLKIKYAEYSRAMS
jgi:hypothetical protein